MSACIMHIGLADFTEPTLLIIVDEASLQWLAERIESRKFLDFATASSVKLINVSLLLHPVEGGGDLSRHEAKFEWKVSPLEARQFAEQLRVLAACEASAHVYLDSKPNTSGVQLVASKDEYDASIVFIH